MSEIKYYDGGYKDINISIPTNTIEMTIKLKMYEDGAMIGSNMAKDNNKKENPVKNVKTTPLPVKETRYGFYKCKGRIKGE